MQLLIFLGPPGVGKGTASQSLVEHFGYCWLSTGDVLRDAKRSGSEFGKKIAKFIDSGRLVPDELVIELVEHRVAALPDSARLLLDGFPRTLAQARVLDAMLAQQGRQVDMVLELRADQNELVRRILGRSRLGGRADDTLATLQHRLEVFRLQTAPLANYYHDQKKLHVIHAMGSPDDVFGRIARRVRDYLPPNSTTPADEPTA
jgi:adenylate kinase